MRSTTKNVPRGLFTVFASHPQQYNDLRTIAQPLNDLRTSCNRSVSAAQVAALLQAFASP
ncbi:MAG: heme-binding protein [Mycobacteriaceae bacterium]|nr:heme-binding protein [Mycobacteriaceae bacterium]